MDLNVPGLDELDYQILEILIKDSRIPYLEIARNCHVSGGTIHVRMNKMQEMGLIKGARLILDTSKLGYDVCCFIGIYLNKASSYPDVLEQLKEIKEIVELHYTTGAYSIFIKVMCKSISNLQDLLMNRLQVISGVQSTDTFITLSQPIDRNISF
ncbi:Lrp/AsnC ligand binding domain-containing protein [Clostridium estertheticum]|uniref:Lrp/AsnC ligand binding domain-containing protein n=1 Tax=Clostridium estertheticum TaxID=238834 RepID=UPI001C0C19DF|nr:Lrp/AsnC ligand binding domain-containing protein [Clostridium estertheticum]MBU3216261.1 Lrp/AsnC ligand binding domain-containing protein [Clostridium estertheticum]MBW9152691.1 Lrp/AsnC ligand binding domain-containing protein [Clostridium estertheticum]MBX4259997.1 Lrp/AsnC ligand binding domain-containing protein [Clostridium estertheticum]WAG55498.1 Lrp/AsnC ligand binding domain-containing protein [Clostridium estertheticum]WLC72018.1 Lrp/AsnC ligand binding domain-containing protein